MAEEKSAGSWLSKTFNSIAKHVFSIGMVFMMVSMALPAVGAVAAAAGKTATLGDLAIGALDAGWQMISAPFTHGDVAVDAVSNAFNGNVAPGSYEFGAMDHGAVTTGAEHAGHAAGTDANLPKYEEWIKAQNATDQAKLSMMKE